MRSPFRPASPRSRQRLAFAVPTTWFALLVGVTGAALLAWTGRSWNALWLIEAALVVVFVFDTIACATPRKIDVRRQLVESVTLGEQADLQWVVENRHSRAVRVTVTDALWPSLGPVERTFRAEVPAQSRFRYGTTLTPTRRGRFPIRDVTVRVGGPLHIAQRQVTKSVLSTLRVMPAYPSRDEVSRRLRIPRVLESGSRSIRTSGSGTDFEQLRDYRSGDEFRRIDWASSVRFQRPIVKQFRVERNQNVVVLLDNGRVMAGTVAEVPRVEHAMDAALAITQAATRLGDKVGMVTFDRQVRSILPSNNSKAQLAKAAEAMFLLEPELVESAYLAAFNAATSRFRRRSLYVVLTDLVEATVDLALLPALPILTRRHLVVVASVFDPQVSDWATHVDHAWAADAFRQAAAISTFNQRRRAAARLRAAGAVVIDTAPGGLGVELVDTYLELKASGRL